jgi:hypothetical protein
LCERIPDVVPWIKLATLSDSRSCSNPEPRSKAQAGEGCSFAPADEERCIPGQGVLPLSQIIAALEAGGYRGAYDVQLTGERCWRSDYRLMMADCRAALVEIAPELFAGGNVPHSASLPANAVPVNPGPVNPVPVARMP